jgi:hypothetical protein
MKQFSKIYIFLIRTTERGLELEKQPNSDLFILSMVIILWAVHCKKRLLFFQTPAGMSSLTKLSLAGINLIIPGRGEFG